MAKTHSLSSNVFAESLQNGGKNTAASDVRRQPTILTLAIIMHIIINTGRAALSETT